jgi:putative addiction module component (TIGR02574 family)
MRMILERVPQVKEMSLAEKAQLYDELWQELERQFQQMPISEEMIADMDREMGEYRREPSKGSTWEQVRERIRNRARQSA